MSVYEDIPHSLHIGSSSFPTLVNLTLADDVKIYFSWDVNAVPTGK